MSRLPNARVRVWLAAVTLLLLSFSAAMAATVFQADFDHGESAAPAGWKVTYDEGHGIAAWATEGYDSPRSLYLEGTAENEFVTWTSDQFAVEPNTAYLISVMLKSGQGTGPPGLFVGGKHYYLPSVQDWSRWQMRFTTPADMTKTQVRLYLYHRPGQKVWFDDVVVASAADAIIPLEPADNLITPQTPARLSWQPTTPPYFVTISRDETFQKVEHSLTAEEAQVQPPPLGSGLWHWRVVPAVQSPPLDKTLRQLAEVRSFLITGEVAQTQQDTTPPFVHNLMPRPDTTVGPRVTVSADVVEAGKLAKAELSVDGKPCPKAVLQGTAPTVLSAALELDAGEHVATVTATDRAGHTTRETWHFYVGETAVPRYRIGANLNLLRDDQPLFPIGIYDYDDFKHLDELFNAGFTYIVTGGPSSKAEMDATLAAGLKIVIGVDTARKAKTVDEARNLLMAGPMRNMLHPALLAYWSDEIEGESFDPELATEIQALVKRFDPAHPFAACIASPKEYAAFGRNADVLWPDVYPVPRDPMTAISRVLDLAVANQAGKKPVWFMAQGFDWSVASTGQPEDGKTYRPTGAELRCMSYLGLNHGAKGICYWAAGAGKCAISRWPERFQELLALTAELRRMAPVYLSEPVQAQIAIREAPLDARMWSLSGKRYLVVVNTSREPQLMHATVPKLKAGAKVEVLFEDRALTVGKELVDVFAPLAVHVYQL